MPNTADAIERTIEIKAPISRVWRALSNHAEFGEWFHVKLDQPFVPGEPSTGQITYPGHEHVRWYATVVAVDAETLFSFHWYPYDAEANGIQPNEPTMLVEFVLEPIPQGTQLTVRESGFAQLPEASRDETYRRNSGGWDEQVKNIAKYVE